MCVGLCGRMLMPRVRFTDLLGIDSTRGVTARGCALGGGIEFATTIDGAACLRICAGALAVVVVYPSWCVTSCNLAGQEFLPLLPCGLGFAAGAMVYVALFELLSEALEELRRPVALATCALSAVAMGLAQHVLR